MATNTNSLIPQTPGPHASTDIRCNRHNPLLPCPAPPQSPPMQCRHGRIGNLRHAHTHARARTHTPLSPSAVMALSTTASTTSSENMPYTAVRSAAPTEQLYCMPVLSMVYAPVCGGVGERRGEGRRALGAWCLLACPAGRLHPPHSLDDFPSAATRCPTDPAADLALARMHARTGDEGYGKGNVHGRQGRRHHGQRVCGTGGGIWDADACNLMTWVPGMGSWAKALPRGMGLASLAPTCPGSLPSHRSRPGLTRGHVPSPSKESELRHDAPVPVSWASGRAGRQGKELGHPPPG